MALSLLAPLTLAALTLFGAATTGGSDRPTRPVPRIVDVRGAASLVARGATVLDARDAAAFATGHLPSAQHYAWQKSTGSAAQQGRLKSELVVLAQWLAVLGVDLARPVLVYGHAGQGLGEEGHAAWLLMLLGHGDVSILDGGFAAWRVAGRPVVTSVAPPRPGVFAPGVRESWRALRADLAVARQIVDVRSAVEFRGATPFGEARGGHLPTARHFDWRSIMDDQGRALAAVRIQKAMAAAGIDGNEEIVVCCSNGVRSAYVAAVLAARGVPRVRCYDGGLLEWSSDPAAELAR